MTPDDLSADGRYSQVLVHTLLLVYVSIKPGGTESVFVWKRCWESKEPARFSKVREKSEALSWLECLWISLKQKENKTSTQARPLLLPLALPLSWKAPTWRGACLCKSSWAQAGSWVTIDNLLKKTPNKVETYKDRGNSHFVIKAVQGARCFCVAMEVIMMGSQRKIYLYILHCSGSITDMFYLSVLALS